MNEAWLVTKVKVKQRHLHRMHYIALSGKIHRKPSEKRALASATRKWLGEIALESMQDQEHLAAKQVYCSHNIAACQTLTG